MEFLVRTWITSVSLKIHFTRDLRVIYAKFLTQPLCMYAHVLGTAAVAEMAGWLGVAI